MIEGVRIAGAQVFVSETMAGRRAGARLLTGSGRRPAGAVPVRSGLLGAASSAGRDPRPGAPCRWSGARPARATTGRTPGPRTRPTTVLRAPAVGDDGRERRDDHRDHAHATAAGTDHRRTQAQAEDEERQAAAHQDEVGVAASRVHTSRVRPDGRRADRREGPHPGRGVQPRGAALAAGTTRGARVRRRWRPPPGRPVWATTVRSAVAPGTRARSVQVPGAAKKRNCPVAEVGTSAVNSPRRCPAAGRSR